MKPTSLSVSLLAAMLVAAPAANAAIPLLNAECPGGLSVHADEGGPVYVNGKEAKLKRFNDNYFEAKDAKTGVTVSISRTPDGSTSVSYTGPGKKNGVCEVKDDTVGKD
ncbi:hypothetical protein QLQ15_00835 [Lysobacter sp. LF1]|uniref:Uncharacterized protein n=1 Tax=Lysobacter stagni TaxID=3045172 RepID=A0ABT6XBE4_9GAMM|nr:hypothetical protein [Lysobacter sp. LF1]MDI9237456.1 hypothetical protein [Lysobacter sp. LF1]